MDNLDDLKLRIERVTSEVKDIIRLFEKEIAEPRQVAAFRQIKEIEASIERFKRSRLPVPEELKLLKLKLFSTYENYQETLTLYNGFLESIDSLTLAERKSKTGKIVVRETKTGRSPQRKPPNYEKPLGSKGYSNLEDYLIPVIKLMWNGYDHREAFLQIAKNLDVRYNTVSSQCTRTLGLTTDEFRNKVNSKTIVDLIESKYPDQYLIIKAQLKSGIREGAASGAS